MRHILVPLAHTASNAGVLELAAAMATGIEAQITLLHVYEPPNSMVGIVPGATVGNELDRDRDAGRTLLVDAAETLARAGISRVSSILTRGAAEAAILENARDADLIVMGTHGRRGIDRALFGSIAERIIRRAPCPVITIHL